MQTFAALRSNVSDADFADLTLFIPPPSPIYPSNPEANSELERHSRPSLVTGACSIRARCCRNIQQLPSADRIVAALEARLFAIPAPTAVPKGHLGTVGRNNGAPRSLAYFVAIYDWSLYTLPSAIPMSDIEGDTFGNSTPSWLGETFTYNGGSSTLLEINDDDSDFQDGYVETGGAQTLAQDVTINGTTYLAGSVVENEFSMLDASGNEIWVVRIDGVNVGFTYPAGEDPTPGQTFTGTVARDGDPLDSDDGVSSSEPYSDIICYAPGTMIDTPDGARAVETLAIGDLVDTVDHGPMPILWVRHGDQPLEVAEQDAKPVLIAAGALGTGLPAQDLTVSPQHRIIVGGGGQLQDRFKTEAFAPAKSLTSLHGIRHMMGKRQITWIHFACEAHEVVIANGCLSESLLLGPMVLDGLTGTERRTLTDIFGSASAPDTALNGPPARECLTVGAVRRQLKESDQEKSHRLTKETRKWDVGLAMEQYEVERMREAKVMHQSGNSALRVA